MSKSVTKGQKLSTIAIQCKNRKLMDSLINTYQTSTKTAVENILNMCIAVKEIDEKRKAKEINDFDVMYFCATVSLDCKSATYRKYRKIGEHAERFKKHMDSLPSAYSVLFHITTLHPEKFEEMIELEQISPSLSLEKLKQLTNSSTKTTDPDEVNFKVNFNMKNLSSSSKDYLKKILIELMSFNDIEVVVPEKHQPAMSYHSTLLKVPKFVPTVNKTKSTLNKSSNI